MNDLPTLVWVALCLLALLMGFVADRTSLCTVGAVAEIMVKRRASVLLNIARIVLWIFAISTFIAWLFGVTPLNYDRFSLGWMAIIGGLVFGLGAALNGGCSLQTITRLGRGNLGMIISIAGMPLGAALARVLLLGDPRLLPNRDTDPTNIQSGLLPLLIIALGVWALWELLRVFRGFGRTRWKTRLLAPDYQPSSSAAILGIANGILFSLVGTWMFTYTLIQSLTNFFYPDSFLYRTIPLELWWLLGGYLVGITLSAIQSRHLLLKAAPETAWLRYFFGGIFMGLGAALVPGGNDMLLLNAIPGLSLHALPAYLAMLAGIAISLAVVMKLFPDHEIC